MQNLPFPFIHCVIGCPIFGFLEVCALRLAPPVLVLIAESVSFQQDHPVSRQV